MSQKDCQVFLSVCDNSISKGISNEFKVCILQHLKVKHKKSQKLCVKESALPEVVVLVVKWRDHDVGIESGAGQGRHAIERVEHEPLDCSWGENFCQRPCLCCSVLSVSSSVLYGFCMRK